jgi:hypothetical protein
MSAERKRQEELEADAATDSEGFVKPAALWQRGRRVLWT